MMDCRDDRVIRILSLAILEDTYLHHVAHVYAEK